MEEEAKDWDEEKEKDLLGNLPQNQSKQITIVSFLWGDWFGKGEEYLQELETGIRSNTTYELEFICLRNETAKVKEKIGAWQFRPLQSPSQLHNLKKLGLYNPANAFHGKLFACDLDIMIIGSLDEIFQFDGEFCIKGQHQFIDEHNPYIPDGDLCIHNIDPDRWAKVWKWITTYIDKIKDRTKGQERLFYQYYGRTLWPNLKIIQEEFPGQVRSFKKDKIRKRKQIPPGTRIVSFHGKKVKPHMINWMEGYN